MQKPKLWVAIGAVLLLVSAGVATAAVLASDDFGQQTQEQPGGTDLLKPRGRDVALARRPSRGGH